MIRIEQVVVSKSEQRIEFFKCNPDMNESVFNKYWNELIKYDLPELFPNHYITIIDKDLDSIEGKKVVIEYN